MGGRRGGAPAAPRTIRVLWAWAGPDGWSAPDTPRLEFATAGVLYKLYLIHEPNPGPSGPDPALDLAGELLPAIDTGGRTR